MKPICLLTLVLSPLESMCNRLIVDGGQAV